MAILNNDDANESYELLQSTIGGTSRATFEIPDRLMNITIYPIMRNVAVQTVFRIVSAVTIQKTICGTEWDIL